MLLGVLYALMQHDLKRLLAYHSIENIGIILVAAGVGMVSLSIGQPGLAVLALSASLLHVLNHALFKGLLFLGAGGVVAATGTRRIEQMGGLARRMPWTAGFFLLGAMAISGLPFLNGFVSEWLVFQSLLLAFHTSGDAFVRLAFPVGGALLGLTTALAAACFVKAFGITFLALPRGAGAAEARESGALMLAPQAALALACVAIGLFPGPLVSVPYTLELNDIPMMVIQHHGSAAWVERARDQFDRLHAEGAKNPRVMALAVHPYISGVPHRIKYFEAVYDYMKKKPGVWFATGEEIYDWYRSER